MMVSYIRSFCVADAVGDTPQYRRTEAYSHWPFYLRVQTDISGLRSIDDLTLRNDARHGRQYEIFMFSSVLVTVDE